MKIDIFYTLYTDGDYCLREPEKFGGKRDDDSSYTYNGSVTFTDEEFKCKSNARVFLWKFLCDGLHISYTHHWLIEDFYHCIAKLVDGINAFESGKSIVKERISGNYDGTEFILIMSE